MPRKNPDTPAKESFDEFEARMIAKATAEVPAGNREDPTLTATIQDAARLLEQKARILAELQECRQLATLLVGRGVGSAEQVAWVWTYLPRKSRGGSAAEAKGVPAGHADEGVPG